MFLRVGIGSSDSYFSSRRGQVTIFIILGILLLLSVVLLLLVRNEQIGFDVTTVIPSKKGVVENQILECITQIGEDGLRKAGMQGGYIELPERYTADLKWHLPLSDFLAVPLWANGNQIDSPSLEEIKIELDQYIEENVRGCLFENNQALEKTFTLIEIDEIKSDLKFEDSHTAFDVHWNIVVQDKTGEVVSELVRHNARSEVKFKTMYETASNILDTEMKEFKLEDLTQDLISIGHENVPVSGMELSCIPKKWREESVKQTLQEMIRINMRSLRVEGSSFTDYSDLYPYYQNHYVWNLLGEVSDEMEVTFRYEPNFLFEFQVTPSPGGIMKSSQMGGSGLIKFLCLQQWKFTYDVEYPLLVQVKDADSDVVLQMGLSVNLIQNYPNKGGVIYSRPSYVSGPAVSQEEYCRESSYVLPITAKTFSEISNGANGVYFRESLEEVNVSYTCLKYTCEMGSSEYNFEERGDVAGVTALVPYCSGGILRAEKEGYLDTWIYTDIREGDEHELNLRPLLTFPLSAVEVVKHQISSELCEDEDDADENGLCVTIEGSEERLAEDETAMITIRMLTESLTESDNLNNNENLSSGEVEDVADYGFFALTGQGDEIYSSEFVYSNVLDEDFMDEAEVELLYGADFEYDLQITLVNEKELIGGFSDKVFLPWGEVANSDKLIFHVLSVEPGDDEYYTLLSKIDSYSEGIVGVEMR